MEGSTRKPSIGGSAIGMEQRTGKTFFMPKFQHKPNNIREVVEWARTARGGRQKLFPILHEREACESKYGLCE